MNHKFFRNVFFPSTVKEWGRLNYDFFNSHSFTILKSKFLKFNPPKNGVFENHNLKEVKLITCFSLDLSHLRKRKLKYNFQNLLNPFCVCGSGKHESSSHYLLDCSILVSERMTLLDSIRPAIIT